MDCVKTKEKEKKRFFFFFFFFILFAAISSRRTIQTGRSDEKRQGISILCSFPGTPGPFCSNFNIGNFDKKSRPIIFSRKCFLARFLTVLFFFFFFFVQKQREEGGDNTFRDCKKTIKKSYLVDPASSHMLVSKIKPCMSKYKRDYTVRLRMAH